MRLANDSLVQAALDLAWSQWVGLGVRGALQAPDTAVDLEALLCFTAYVIPHDPRLGGEVADWWQRFHHHISEPRLKVMARRFGEASWHALRSALTTARRPSGKSRLDRLDTPARSMLRLRSVFGANARAEILLEMLTAAPQASDGWTALALSQVGYSKRNVAITLDDLTLGGVLAVTPEGNRRHYSIVDRDALAQLLQPLPTTSGRWHMRLPLIARFLELSWKIRGRDALVQGVEAQKLFARLKPEILVAGVRAKVDDAFATTYWPTLQQWVIDNLISERGDARRSLDGIIEGTWIGPKDDLRPHAHPDGAVLPRLEQHTNKDKRELLCLDLVQTPIVGSPTNWSWSVLSNAATGTYLHTIGLDRGERWRFQATAVGDIYDVSYDKALSPERIAKLYGRHVATRARTDRPAIQLRLRLVSAASGRPPST